MKGMGESDRQIGEERGKEEGREEGNEGIRGIIR